MLTTARDRMAAATGALFVVLIIIGNQISMSGATQSAHPDGAAVLRDAARQAESTFAAVGFVLEILGFLAFLAFLGYLLDARRRTPGPRASTFAAGTAVLAGLTMLVLKLASIAPAGALLTDRSTLSPETAQALNDMNGVSFVLSWLPFAVFVGAAAAGLYQSALVGRPTMIIGAVIGAGGLAFALLGLQNPLGGGNPIGWLLGLLWTLVVSLRLAVRPGTRPVIAEEGSAAAVPVQV